MASELNTPPVLLKPFADSGDKNTIPETATGTQQASLDEGFPPVTSLPLTQGGIPPERKDFNGLGNLLSKQYFYLQNGGRFTFNQDVSDAIGGYPQNATLWFKDEALGISYPVTSLINNNTYNFVTTPSYIDGVKWKRVIDSFPSTQITNCLTEIPQDIKLELNNGTLTLKAGSKVYKLDGTQVNITADRSVTISVVDTKWFVYCSNAGTSINNYSRVDRTGSGSSLPGDNTTYNYFYNTTDNKIYAWVSGAWSEQTTSFPICIVTVSNGAISSIDQVFNGFGYIGSTVFALPGVKGLIPNGRNTDGTLKNTEFETSSVLTRTYSGNGNVCISLKSNAINWHDLLQYDEKNNININIYNGSIVYNCNAGTLSLTNGKITSFKPKTAFHAVDYNDFSDLSNKVDTNISNITTLQNTKQDEATAVNYDNISNCITEIPQDIKLELNNGTLTLKAGSKITAADGTTNTTTSDQTGTLTTDDTYFVFVGMSDGSFQSDSNCTVSKCGSGTTLPADGTTYRKFLNTTDNKMYRWTTDGWKSWAVALPVAVVTVSSGAISSIDQVFNGFGYIGSTVFALPGVKGLIPNGRNADGSLKNTPFTVSKVLTASLTGIYKNVGIWVGAVNLNLTKLGSVGGSGVWAYHEDINLNMQTSGVVARCLAGTFDITSSAISNFNTKTAFHAVDYNDFEKAMLKEDWVRVSTPPASPDSSKFYYIPEN